MSGMIRVIRDTVPVDRLDRLKQAVLMMRGVLLIGRRFACPCCGWSLRGFVGRWGLMRTNADGYCPRCNAKARHRRAWLWLETHISALGCQRVRVLDIAPWPSFSRCARRHPSINYLGMDVERTRSADIVADVTAMPLSSSTFDVVMCVHVLEHVSNDRAAIDELYRVVQPGGVVAISVPLRDDGPTIEDPSITDPEERAAVFGERGHVRWYGLDLQDRLLDAGFEVVLERAEGIPGEVRRRFGLRSNDHIFRCVKMS